MHWAWRYWQQRGKCEEGVPIFLVSGESSLRGITHLPKKSFFFKLWKLYEIEIQINNKYYKIFLLSAFSITLFYIKFQIC